MPINPKLRTFDVAMIVVSLVIGVGIFRTPAMVASAASHPLLFFLAWILGGLVSICGALTYAEIGSRYHVPGGFYKIFSHCYHPAYAFMVNWVLVLTYGAGAAGVALIGVEYLAPVVFPESWQTKYGINTTVILLVLFFGMLNYLGIKTGARTQNILSATKIIMLLALFAGIFYATDVPPETLPLPDPPDFIGALGISLIAIFYTYGGYQQTMNFGGDIKNAAKGIPRGIMVGMGIVIILYLGVNYAYYHVLGFERLMHSKLVASDMAGRIFGPAGFKLVSIMIFVSVMGFVNVTIMSVPRVFYAMADDGMLPAVFKKVNPKTQTQEFALVFFIGIIILSVFLLGTFEKIVSYVMSIDSIALATGAATLFILRKRHEGDFAGYRIPFYPVTPLIFILFLLIVTVNVLISDTVPAMIGLGLFAAGLPLYYLLKKFIPEK